MNKEYDDEDENIDDDAWSIIHLKFGSFLK